MHPSLARVLLNKDIVPHLLAGVLFIDEWPITCEEEVGWYAVVPRGHISQNRTVHEQYPWYKSVPRLREEHGATVLYTS